MPQILLLYVCSYYTGQIFLCFKYLCFSHQTTEGNSETYHCHYYDSERITILEPYEHFLNFILGNCVLHLTHNYLNKASHTAKLDANGCGRIHLLQEGVVNIWEKNIIV